METSIIQGEFAALIIKVICSIRRRYEPSVEDAATYEQAALKLVKDFATFLRQIKCVNLTAATNDYLLFTPTILHEIETTCSDINDVFTKLEGYYTWFSLDLIEKIIATFCERDTDVIERLSKYLLHYM